MTKFLKYSTCLFLILLVLIACKDEENECPACQQEVIISNELYQNAPDDHLQIMEAAIIGNCLHITFASSGCSGDSWEIKLLDQGAIMKSDPPQRNLRLSLKNEELCDAWFTRDISFDISALQVDGNRVLLNITNSGEQLLYEYK